MTIKDPHCSCMKKKERVVLLDEYGGTGHHRRHQISTSMIPFPYNNTTTNTTIMLCRALPIRPATATAFACKLQPQCAKTALQTASGQLTTRPQSTILSRTYTHQSSQLSSRIRIQLQSKRPNSTTTTTASGTNKATEDPDAVLTWNRFLTLRKTRRRVSLVASVVGGLTFFGAGIIVLTTNDFDQMGAQHLGLDPFITLGLGTFACGTLGWLLGPFLGTALFNMYYKRLVPQMRVVCFLEQSDRANEQ